MMQFKIRRFDKTAIISEDSRGENISIVCVLFTQKIPVTLSCPDPKPCTLIPLITVIES